MNKYKSMDFGRTEAVFNKLGGLEGIEHFLSGRTEVRALSRTFKVWKTITVGSFIEQQTLLSFLEKSERFRFEKESSIDKNYVLIRDDIKDLFETDVLRMYQKIETVNLTVVTLEDLGYKKGESAAYEGVCRWAKQLGLEMVLHEAIFQFCIENIEDSFGGHFTLRFAATLLQGTRSWRDMAMSLMDCRENRSSGEAIQLYFDAYGSVRPDDKLVFRIP